MADQTKGTSRSIYIDSSAAESAMKRLQDQADKIRVKINAGEAAGKSMNKELAKLDQVNAKIKSVQQQLDAGLKPTLQQQESLVRQLRNELSRLSDNDPKFKQKLADYQKQNAELRTMRERIGEVAKTEGAMQKFGNTFTKVFEVAASYLVIEKLFSGIKEFFGGTIHEAIEAEEQLSRFHNTLENIGRTEVFESMVEQADEMAKKFKYVDNDEVLGIFTKLITYGKLTKHQIEEITPVIIDFAAKQKVSFEEATSVIIKALEGNGKGLKEYGINLKDAGTVTDRFGVIMTDLKVRVDGAGDAFGKTFSGQVAIARQEMKDAQEDIGKRLIPALAGLLKFTSEGLKGLGSVASFVKNAFSFGVTTAFALNNAEAASAGKAEADKRAADSVIENIKNEHKDRELTAKQIIVLLAQENVGTLEKLKEANLEGNRKLVNTYTQLFKTNRDAILQLKKEVDPAGDKILGAGGNDKNEELIKKAEEARKKLDDIERELRKDIASAALPELDAEYVKIQEKLQKTLAEIHATSAYVPAARIKADSELAVKTAQEEIDKAFRKFHKNQKADYAILPAPSFDEKEFENNLKSQVLKPGGIVDRVTSFFSRDKTARAKLTLLKAQPGSKEELDARISLLRDELRKELDSTEHTEAEIAEIRERYRQSENELTVNFFSEKAKQYLQYAQQVIGILDQLNQAQSNRENAQLRADIKNNDVRRKDIDRLSKSKVITEVEARRQLAAIDREEQKKKDDLEKKQLERGKKIAIAQALVNGAMGITSVLAAKPGVADILTLSAFRAINIALTVATTAAQVAAISGQKFSKGGIPQGASHAEGGIKLYDTKSRRVVGEMEGGEPYMILSKNFRRNNPDFIAAALDSSMNRNGARIRPFWQTRPYSHLAYGGIISNQSIVRRFANGGITNQPAPTSQQHSVETENEELTMVLKAVLFRLENPIIPNIDVHFPLTKLEDAQAQKARIVSEATG